jgi:hypothetical protein
VNVVFTKPTSIESHVVLRLGHPTVARCTPGLVFGVEYILFGQIATPKETISRKPRRVGIVVRSGTA